MGAGVLLSRPAPMLLGILYREMILMKRKAFILAIALLISALSVTPALAAADSLPALMYHCFYDESAGEAGPDGLWLEIKAFEEQMKYLNDNEYYFPSWDEVYRFTAGEIELPEKSVVITIDDGHESFYRHAIPVLQKYDITATAFVVTSWSGEDFIARYASDTLNFRSHSHDMHRAGYDGKGRFLTMTYDGALEDLRTSASIVGYGDVFCYPYGHYSDFTVNALEDAGFDLAFTTEYGNVRPGAERLKLPRIRISKGESLYGFIGKIS